MLSNHPNCLGGNGPSASSDLIGDVDGPASATDNAVARFDGTTGKLIQNSVVTIADSTGDIAGASSLTSPAASPLTLGTGTSGAAITVLSANNNVGIGTTSPSTLLHLKSTGSLEQIMERAAGTNYAVLSYNTTAGASWGIGTRSSSVTPADSFSIYSSTLGANAVTVSNAGGVTIAGTTAGSAGAGALVVTGGLATGATSSYFGGVVTTGGLTVANASQLTHIYTGAPNNFAWGIYNTAGDASINVLSSASLVLATNNTARLTISAAGALSTTGAATFAGAVSGAAATFRPASDGVGLTLNQANSASAGWSFSALNTGSLAVTRVGGVAAITCDLNGSTTFYTSGTQTFGAVVISSGNTLKLGNAYVGTPVVSTGYITIQDNTGTTYKVAVSL